MENQSAVEPSDMKEKVIYELAADGACEFENGESIRIGRNLLAIHSRFFMEVFFGQHKTKIKIKGFDRASFKTFLDCLFGVNEYTLLDALVIYPIAHRYEVKESLGKCTAVLKPKDVNENVSRVLNLATFYNCNELTDYVISFVKTKYGIFNFLENKEYSIFLEPSSMIKLIEIVDLNSLVWTLVFQWSENYLKQREKSDIKSFLIEHGIFEKISFAHFESSKAIINFNVMSNKQLLCSDEVLCHLQNNSLKFDRLLPDRSDWVKINSGHSYSETVVFKHLFIFSANKKALELSICISQNKILLEPENSVSAALKVKARYIFRQIVLNCNYNTDNIEPPIYRPDLNFFYREALLPNTMDFLLSPFAHSDEFDVDLIDGNFKMPTFKVLVKAPVIALEVHSVEITYSFDCECRILKASLDTNKKLVDDNNLYFTRDVSMLRVI